MGCRSIFTPEEDDVLRRLYAQLGARGCATRIDKTIKQIWNRAYILGVAKPRMRPQRHDSSSGFDHSALSAALGMPAHAPGIPFPSHVTVCPAERKVLDGK